MRVEVCLVLLHVLKGAMLHNPPHHAFIYVDAQETCKLLDLPTQVLMKVVVVRQVNVRQVLQLPVRSHVVPELRSRYWVAVVFEIFL